MTEIQDCIKCDRTFEVTSDSGFHCVDCRKTTEQPDELPKEVCPYGGCPGCLEKYGITPRESVQPVGSPVNEKDVRHRVMAAIRSYGISHQDKADIESRTDGVMIVLGEYVLPFVRKPKRESVQPVGCPLVVDRLIAASEKMKEWMECQYSDTDFDLDGHMAEVHAEFCIALYGVRKYYREPAPLVREVSNLELAAHRAVFDAAKELSRLMDEAPDMPGGQGDRVFAHFEFDQLRYALGLVDNLKGCATNKIEVGGSDDA